MFKASFFDVMFLIGAENSLWGEFIQFATIGFMYGLILILNQVWMEVVQL